VLSVYTFGLRVPAYNRVMGLDISGAFVATAASAASSSTEDPDAEGELVRSAPELVRSAPVIGELVRSAPELVRSAPELVRSAPVTGALVHSDAEGKLVRSVVRSHAEGKLVRSAVRSDAAESTKSTPFPAHTSSHELLGLNI
jgi:hypothetical protein